MQHAEEQDLKYGGKSSSPGRLRTWWIPNIEVGEYGYPLWRWSGIFPFWDSQVCGKRQPRGGVDRQSFSVVENLGFAPHLAEEPSGFARGDAKLNPTPTSCSYGV